MNINNQQEIEDFTNQLIILVEDKLFRTAWNYLTNNIDREDSIVAAAGIILEDLSNNYGDIGNLKDDCIIKKTIEFRVKTIINLLR